MNDFPALQRVLTAAAKAGVSGTGVEVWRVRFTRHATGTITLDIASSLGRIHVDAAMRMAGTWCSLDVLHADVAAAVRGAVAERQAAREHACPDLVEHIVGYRVWRLDGRQLAPLHSGVGTWDGGNEVRAVCGVERRFRSRNGFVARMPDGRGPAPSFGWHEAPGPKCHCGLYAWSVPPAPGPQDNGQDRVLGAVAARGIVEAYDSGFRAQLARPVLFAYADDGHDRYAVTALGRLHGVAVCVSSELRERALEFGQAIPDALRP